MSNPACLCTVDDTATIRTGVSCNASVLFYDVQAVHA